MSTTTFKGARYIVKFYDSWDSANSYEAIVAVLHEGCTYLSKQPVPAGVQIDNTEFWLKWADPNAQMEQLYQLVQEYKAQVESTILDIETITDDVNTSKNKVNNIGARYYVTPTVLEDTLSIVDNSYIQGCTTDDTYIYVYAVSQSGYSVTPYITKYDSEFNIIERFYFIDYPNVGHGNSIAYDPVNQTIVILSSNRTATYLDTDLNVLSHESLGTNQYNYQMSQIAMNTNYLVTNITQTNKYAFYKRCDPEFFVLYGYADIPLSRGKFNLVQDAFMIGNNVYSVTSSVNGNTYIDCFGVYGQYICTFIINGINKEFEGAFPYGSDVYLIASDGSMATIPKNLLTISDINVNQTLASNFKRAIARGTDGMSTSTVKGQKLIDKMQWIKSTTYPSSYLPSRIIHVDEYSNFNRFKDSSLNERILFLGNNTYGGCSITNGSLRFVTLNDSFLCLIQYTVSGNIQYLNRITAYKLSDGTSIVKNFTASETEESKIEKLDAINVAMGIENFSFVPLGCNYDFNSLNHYFFYIPSPSQE